jgi:iron complex outermembrane recepter protein
MIKRRFILGTTTAIAALAVPYAACAQSSSADEGTEEEQGLEEIVVTAQRSESAAQRTPIALTVYSGEALASQGVSDVESLANVDPSVNFTVQNGTPYVAVRGIASADITEIGDPSVPISRDGFFSNRPYAIQLGMYDVARVEVLKGPQGTLNGRNSTGGLINVITKRPERESGGYGSVEVGNYGMFNGELGVNAAFSDQFQMRVSGVLRHRNGYRLISRIGVPGVSDFSYRSEDDESHSIRIQAAAEPVEGLNFWVSYQHDNIDEAGPSYLRLARGVVGTSGYVPTFGNVKSYAGFAPIYNRVSGDRVVWEASYNRLPFDASLIYSGGYEKLEYMNRGDSTFPGAANPASTDYQAIRVFQQNQFPTTWNHEIRIVTPLENTISFTGGYFNFREDNQVVDAGILNLACTGTFAPGGANASRCQAGNFGLRFNFDVDTKSEALFGQIGVRLGDQLRFTVGGRQTWDRKSRVGTIRQHLAALANPNIGAPPTVTSQSPVYEVDKFIYHLGLDWTPSPDTLVYAKYDTGYKAGGFNVTTAGVRIYDPETVETFEIGTKNRFAGNTIQLNLNAFYTRYGNYQASQIADGFLQILNTGASKIYGVEGQFSALVGSGTRFDLNAAYLHTEFDNGVIVPEGSNAGNAVLRNVGGNRLPNAPSFAAGVGVQQDFDIGSGTMTARLDGKYTSKYFFTVFNDLDTTAPSSFVANASITYKHGNGVWDISAFVRNFTDETVVVRAVRNLNSNSNDYAFAAPRTFGVRGSFKF